MKETVIPVDALPIAAVESETGLSKDVLRVWERRYGFPKPLRSSTGERVYPRSQLERLRLVRRLIDQGLRPGSIFALSSEELETQAAEAAPPQPRSAFHDLALYLLKTHQTSELRRELHQAVMRDGLHRFIEDTAAPLAILVGDAWMRGEIQVFEEHLFTEQLQGVLRQAISQVPTGGGAPRVLLTTLPGEQHGLGLLMAEAALALEGAECFSLGTQTPVSDIMAAALAKRADVVALSVSSNYATGPLEDSLTRLRAAVPPATEIWLGGAGAARVRRALPGLRTLKSLGMVGETLATWRGDAVRDARPRR